MKFWISQTQKERETMLRLFHVCALKILKLEESDTEPAGYTASQKGKLVFGYIFSNAHTTSRKFTHFF